MNSEQIGSQRVLLEDESNVPSVVSDDVPVVLLPTVVSLVIVVLDSVILLFCVVLLSSVVSCTKSENEKNYDQCFGTTQDYRARLAPLGGEKKKYPSYLTEL